METRSLLSPCAVQTQLSPIVAELRALDGRLCELSEAIELEEGRYLASQLWGGIETVRRDLLSDGIATLSVLADLSEEGAGRRRAETLELLERVAIMGTDLVRTLLDRPTIVVEYLGSRYARPDQEVFGVLYLDVRNRLLEEVELFRGTLVRTAVEPRAILRRALELSAAGMIAWHTHPSGDASPSPEDLAFTQRLQQAAELMGVRFLDHLILGHGGRWRSLQLHLGGGGHGTFTKSA
jgi:DNA repair protein RadC